MFAYPAQFPKHTQIYTQSAAEMGGIVKSVYMCVSLSVFGSMAPLIATELLEVMMLCVRGNRCDVPSFCHIGLL